MKGIRHMSRVVQLVVLATGAGLGLLSGCADTEGGGAEESLKDYIGYSPLGSEHEEIVALAAENKLTDEEKRQERSVEDFLVTCMRDEGFEYVPLYPEDVADQGPIEIQASMSPEAFAKKYGYGLSTFSPDGSEGAADPNDKIRDGLSPDAQKAYDEALWGDAGCHGRADKEVNDGADAEELKIETEFKDLAEDVTRLSQRLADDPRMAAATTRWADCMADGGYPGLEQTVDAENLVSARLGSLPHDGDGTAADDVDPKKLRDVQAFELAVASVDFACRQEHIEPERREVATRLEKQFVAEHKQELERFRDRAGDRGIRLGGST
jgi:hypothetical protein